MKRALTAAALALGLAASLTTAPLLAGEAGDAVFAERGPWSIADHPLHWTLTVTGPEVPGFLPITDGAVTLEQIIDPSDDQPALELTQKAEARDRRIGPFPVSAGDPVLTYFLEETTRDMAKLAGGSPFYIRNRIKDAVFRHGEIRREGDSEIAVFHPFANDPNAARMHGFDTLTLTFVMAGDATAPIREMRAETAGEGPGYSRRMVLE